MKYKVPILSAILIVSILSYQINWFNYLLILTIVLDIIYLILLGFISIFKKLNKFNYIISLTIAYICFIGVIVSFFRPYNNPTINNSNTSKNLEYAYNTDQNDRKELRSFIFYFNDKLEKRDSLRLIQVRNYYNQNEISKPIDKFHAAFIFHHSDNKTDYKIASQLAEKAANAESLKDEYVVQWLKRASYDRYMLSIGKPEKYDTQDKFSIDIN